MEKKNFYITTTLPYVNAEPHIGFASEIVYADVRARFEKLIGREVIFNTGTDEHGIKILQNAIDAEVEPQKYVDKYATKFDGLKAMLNLSYTNFIRTTDKHHQKAAQEIWKRVDDNGFIYKKQYSVKYCVGCELEKTDSELENGYCPLHPNKELEVIEEENYFFKFSEFEDKLLQLYKDNPKFVVPKKRLNEIESFVEGGLQDFSISRVASKMPWGVPVPDDPTQVMYVWFDALTNYISTLGWPEDVKNFEKFWGTKENPKAIQIAGKDNLRQQSAMWQAMLMAADLPTSKQVFINGFISVDGQKMSKSIGNVISPKEMVERYGIDGTRYLLLTKGTFGEDNDISWEKLDIKYNADLANGLGNLVSRIIVLAGDIPISNTLKYIMFPKGGNYGEKTTKQDIFEVASLEVEEYMQTMNFKKALERTVFLRVQLANAEIEKKEPWKLKKENPEAFIFTMETLLNELELIVELLQPFMPGIAEKIKQQLKTREKEILFERIK